MAKLTRSQFDRALQLKKDWNAINNSYKAKLLLVDPGLSTLAEHDKLTDNLNSFTLSEWLGVEAWVLESIADTEALLELLQERYP